MSNFFEILQPLWKYYFINEDINEEDEKVDMIRKCEVFFLRSENYKKYKV
jgi:hypothetical protein